MKASKDELSELHGAVAKILKDNLNDPKVLAQAIQFLKNNSITVDELPAKETTSLFSTVQALTKKPTNKEAVDTLLEQYS